MDFTKVPQTTLRYLIRQSLCLSIIVSLTACSLSPVQSLESAPVEKTTEIETTIEATPAVKVEDLPLTAELTYLLLTAEVAQQRGDIVSAAELYSRASELVKSPAVAGRSAQLANLTRDQQRINKALKRWIEVDPNDADIYMLQAPFLMLQGRFDEVVTAVNKALEVSPEKAPLFLSRLTDNLSKIVQADPALSIVRQLTLFQQHDSEALFNYARLAAFYKQYEQALPVVNQVLSQQADHENSLVLKAKVLQRLDKGEQALAVLKAPANRKGASKAIRFSYAKLLGENNNIKESRRFFEQLHQEQADDQEVIFALGLLALEEKDGEQAKHYFHKLLDQGDHGKQAAYFIGLAEKLNKNTEDALIWFSSVPASSSRFEAAQTHYINLLAENGQMAKARDHIKSIRLANPQQAVQYYLFETSFLREQGQEQAAYELFNAALKEHPQQIDLLYGRAMVAEPLNHLDVLENDLRTILKQDPNNTQALNALGYTLTDRTDRHDEALILINKAIELQPNDPFYLDSLGWVYYRLGNLQQAAHYLKKAVAIQDDAEFSAHLGEVLWQQGKQEEAKAIWQHAIERSSDNKLLRETMQRFGL